MATTTSDPLTVTWLQSSGLSTTTIQCLIENGFDSLATLQLMRSDDLRALPINMGQRRLLENCLTKVPGNAMCQATPAITAMGPDGVQTSVSYLAAPAVSVTASQAQTSVNNLSAKVAVPNNAGLVNQLTYNNLNIVEYEQSKTGTNEFLLNTENSSEKISPFKQDLLNNSAKIASGNPYPTFRQEVMFDKSIGQIGNDAAPGRQEKKISPFKQDLLNNSPMLASGSPAIHKIVAREVMFDKSKGLRRCQIGNDAAPGRQEKVLMLVGATGTGKSTLINSIANYILGVDWKDPFRFKIIVEEDEATLLPTNRNSNSKQSSQAHSQTKCITAYTFCLPKDVLFYKLTIVDTPGFGDTQGIERDVQITNQIRHLFDSPRSDSLDYINAVGIIDKASSARLTHCQRYIFDSVLSLFGRDMAKNIFVLATFSDGKEPLVQTALNEARVPYSQLFKINNSAFFSQHSESDDDFDALFWKMGNKSLQKFFIEFEKSESRSLYQTKEVLKQRQKLEVHVENLQQRVNVAHAKLDQIKQEEAVIAQNRQAIDKSQKFTYSVDVSKNTKIDLEKGQYVTNCLQCNGTCHFPCMIADDGEKYNCAAMNEHTADATCTECPGNCSWQMHKNNPYRFEVVSEKETRTDAHLKQQYDTACANKTKSEAMLDDLRKQYKQLEDEAFKMLVDLNNCTNRLSEIALKPNPLSTVDYIDLIIESEKNEHRDGFQQRIAQLKVHRGKAMLLQKSQKANVASGSKAFKDIL